MDPKSDDEILHLLRGEGTMDLGFRYLMEKFQERLYWHIRRMIGTHDDTDDILQDSLIKVYRNIDRFEGKSGLYTWLYRIATNESLSFLRKQKRSKQDALDDHSDRLAAMNADSYFDESQALAKLHKAVAELPDKQKAVFNLKYFDEMSYKDIAEVLGGSIGSLKASYHHATKKIQRALEAE